MLTYYYLSNEFRPTVEMRFEFYQRNSRTRPIDHLRRSRSEFTCCSQPLSVSDPSVIRWPPPTAILAKVYVFSHIFTTSIVINWLFFFYGRPAINIHARFWNVLMKNIILWNPLTFVSVFTTTTHRDYLNVKLK